MKTIYLLILFFTLLIISCNKSNDKNNANANTQSGIATQTQVVQSDTVNSQNGPTKADSSDDCVRAIPEPITKLENYPDRKFILKDRIGYESFTLKNGDKIEIENKGCEYEVIEFHYMTSHYKGDTANIRYWVGAIQDLLNSIDKTIDMPLNIQDGSKALKKYYDTTNVLGEQIDFGDSEIRNFVTLDRIAKITETDYEIMFTFSVGPL